MPLSEIADRYSILRLKIERLFGEDNAIVEQFGIFSIELRTMLNSFNTKTRESIEEEISNLYEYNGRIWDLEYDIRRGALGEADSEEVGKRSIEIRKWNKKRIQSKNRIAILSADLTMLDKKKNHGSE